MIGWLVAAAHAGETPLLPRGADWRYLDTGVDPGPTWTQPAFDDGAWATGAAPLGYGVFPLTTTVSYGPDPLARYPTTWFRTTFDVADPTAFEALSLHLRRDDGAAVYVNGVEVHRSNLAVGATAQSYASTGVYGVDQDTYEPAIVPPGVVVSGTNTVAVELHNQSATSADLVLDLGISGWDGPGAIVRGPWLQQTGPDGAIVRWDTDGPGTGRLWWGAAPGALTQTLDDPVVSFRHALRITGRPPDTDTAYAVGHPTAGRLAGGDADHVFHTAPVPGTRAPFRVWALGDSGTASPDAEAVREAWRTLHPDPLDTDVFLMLGDNAYGSGEDSEYQTAVFDFYPEWLRQVSLWATLGNHDGYSAFSDTQTGPYFDVFTFPTAGEVGGVASGTEAYWSFDYANVHFVDLDSMHSDRAPGGAMATWLEADLSATDADWTVVFFHHPPYSKGSHDSDRETELVEMREFVDPILEDHGVDLVLSGHSHSYERSWLLDGHYGTSDTFDPALHVVQERSGDPSVDRAFTKWAEGAEPHQGTVYVVAGSSGQVSGGALDHPAMLVSLAELGSMRLEFDGLVLRAAFVDDLAVVRDAFEIHKGVTTITELDGGTLGLEGEVLAFHGAATQPDGAPVTELSWDWGDGTPPGAGPDPTHAWGREGAFDVVLTATDDRGATDQATLRVNIDNGAPVIASADVTGVSLEGSELAFSAVASDPGQDPLVYTWTIEGDRYYGSTVLYTFWEDGSYVAHLDVSDDAGRVVSADVPVTIGNAAPFLVSVTSDGAVEGSPTLLTATVDDPGFDFVTVEWALPTGPVLGSRATVTFADSGRMPVDLVLRDDDGAEVFVTARVDVANAPPALTVVPPTGGDEGEPLPFVALVSDPGASDQVAVRWDFGDGVERGAAVEHAFSDDGDHTVTVTASDQEGAQATTTVVVPVDNLPPVLGVVQVPGTVDEGAPVTLRVTAADPGSADTWTAEWSLGGGAGEPVGAEVVATWIVDGRQAASVTVRDDDGGSVTWPFEVEVRNVAPRFVSGPPVTRVDPGGVFTYPVEIEDVDPVALTVAEGPPGASFSGRVLSWTAPDAAGTSVPFRLRAEDDDGGVSEQVFSLAVAGTTAAPPERFVRGEPAPRSGCSTAGGGAWALGAFAALAARRGRVSARRPAGARGGPR